MWARNWLPGAGGVGAYQDRLAVAVRFGDLGQAGVQDRDVVGGGVAAGVAGPQDAGEGLVGVVQEPEDRVVAERMFERRRRLLFLRMADHHAGVQVDDQTRDVAARGAGGGDRPAGFGGLCPGQFPRLGASGPQCRQLRLVGVGQDPPCRRGRSDRPEHRRLLAQDRQVADALPTVGEHHRHIDRDPARVVPGLSLP